MKEFIQYFFGAGEQQEFTIFTFAHLAPILVLAVMIGSLYICREKIRQMKHEAALRHVIAFILIVTEMSYYWRLVGIPALGPNPVQDLPITVCGWAAIFCSYMIVGKSQNLFDISYFWLLCGSTFALITPTVLTYTGPTRFRYYQFWAEHTMGYVAMFYMIFVHGMRPTVKAAIKSYIALVALAIVAYFTNQLGGSGANYLFLARPEAAPSVLDILPSNFAVRTLIMASTIAALYVVAYLPWYFKDRKAARADRNPTDPA